MKKIKSVAVVVVGLLSFALTLIAGYITINLFMMGAVYDEVIGNFIYVLVGFIFLMITMGLIFLSVLIVQVFIDKILKYDFQ